MRDLTEQLLKRAMELRQKAAREAADADELCALAEELEDLAAQPLVPALRRK